MSKRLQCPNCGARLIDQAENTRSEVRLITQSGAWNPDYYAKCWNCKKEVGLKKLN